MEKDRFLRESLKGYLSWAQLCEDLKPHNYKYEQNNWDNYLNNTVKTSAKEKHK